MRVLHGGDAVAALKPHSAAAAEDASHVLHGGDAVAALKRHGSRAHARALDPRPTVLHGGDAVAALKLVGRRNMIPLTRGSPRRRRRGRIEATYLRYLQQTDPGSPRRRRRGRIEAVTAVNRPLVNTIVLHGGDAVAALKRSWQRPYLGAP